MTAVHGVGRAGQPGPDRDETGHGGPAVLLLCTANICRSPMAAALLRRRLASPGGTVPVASAGMLPGGRPVPREVLDVMSGYGTDLSGHVSRAVSAADLGAAGLVVAMSREHVRHAVVTEGECWPRAFTLKELLRRAERAGPRYPGEPLATWLGRLHSGRDRRALLGASPEDDIADPMGGPPESFATTASLLDRLTSRLAWLGWESAWQERLPAAGA